MEKVKIFEGGEQMWINYKGVYNLTGLYKVAFDWLTKNGFKHLGTGDANFEDYYLEITLPGGAAKNHWIWWRTKKQLNDYMTLYVNLDFQTLVTTKTEVMMEGQKVKANSGELSLFFTGYIEYDDSVWKSSALSNMLYKHLRRGHYEKLISESKSDSYDEVMEFYDTMKQHLGMWPTVTNLRKTFHPQGGNPLLSQGE